MLNTAINNMFNYLIILVALLFSTQILGNNALPVKDIRIVIDMSGSMKKNDPLNHRTKAVQLFSEVLPDGIQSGIWTFAAEVNMLIKHGTVTKNWKKSAFNKANKIHSYGLYTNIEKALKKSTYDWSKPEPGKEKHLILLTDGYIDISKDAKKNTQSRENVIKQVLPFLKKNKINVHSIALSEFADHKLLKKLSSKTGGSYVVIKNASDLDRHFFKLFQSTAKPDTIPFKRNKFTVDKSINDLTIVLFNNNNPTKLVRPDKNIWSYAKHPKKIKWVKSDNYEIITIPKPTEGSWSVDAPLDPDNKVMIVTNIRLHVNKLPTVLLPNDPMPIEATISEDGKIITKKDFINILDVKSVVQNKDSISRKILDTKYTENGIFKANVNNQSLKDRNTLTVTVRSPTFTREFQHEFNVIQTPVLIEKNIEDKNIILNATINDSVIDRNNVNIKILKHEGQHLFNKNNIGKWTVALPQLFSGKSIDLLVKAKRHNGQPFEQTQSVKLPEIIQSVAPVKVQKTKETKKSEATSEKINVPVTATEQNIDTEKKINKNEPVNWIMVFAMVLTINILIFTGGYFLYKKYIKSAKQTPRIDAEETDTPLEDKDEAESTLNAETTEGLDEIEDLDVNEDKVNENTAK